MRGEWSIDSPKCVVLKLTHAYSPEAAELNGGPTTLLDPNCRKPPTEQNLECPVEATDFSSVRQELEKRRHSLHCRHRFI